MTTSFVTACDGPGCDSRTPPVVTDRPRGWLRVEEDGRVLAFCGWDCVLAFVGRVEPAETVAVDIRGAL